eukprot:g4308.t1
MKFRAKFACQRVKQFTSVVSALEKMSPFCLLHLSRNAIKFVVKSRAGTEGCGDCEAYATLATTTETSVFEAYRVSSRADDTINLEVNLPAFLRALKSAVNAPVVTLKLTKNGACPCLTLHIRRSDVGVKQDCPVRVLPRDSTRAEEPQLDLPELRLRMPSNLKKVRIVTEKLKAIDKFLYIEAHVAPSGSRLVLKIDAAQASIATFFKDLHGIVGSGKENHDTIQIRVKVDAKRFSQILQCHNAAPEHVWLLICERATLVLYCSLEHGAGNITYYLPVLEEFS